MSGSTAQPGTGKRIRVAAPDMALGKPAVDARIRLTVERGRRGGRP